MRYQYRATITCTDDPCTYCHGPGRTQVVEHPDGPFTTEAAALAHAEAHAYLVLGASVHRCGVQRREVGAWEAVPA